MNKVCSKCNNNKHIGLFASGSSICKECKREYDREYRNKNKDKISKRRSKYYAKNKKTELKNNIAYKRKNKNILKQKNKEYRERNKEKILCVKRKYYNSVLKHDILFKLKSNIRGRMWSALNGDYKPASSIKDLGCTLEELKSYLESMFYKNPDTKEEMSWDNYGINGWHVDHVRPLKAFDLTDAIQFKEACHYTNLQPLWAKDNLIKGSAFDEN